MVVVLQDDRAITVAAAASTAAMRLAENVMTALYRIPHGGI